MSHSINFINWRQHQTLFRKRSLFSTLAIVAILSCSIEFISYGYWQNEQVKQQYYYQQLSWLQREQSQLAAELSEQYAVSAQFQQSLAIHRELKRQQQLLPDLLTTLSHSVSSQLALRRFTQTGERIVVDGEFTQPEIFRQFIEALTLKSRGREITIENVQSNKHSLNQKFRLVMNSE
ncbi:hypothetical protein [Vibrio viridaestus]|uniref:Pilus assembly protein PilN n=1 Tax=Vibrio viridaestus TaxID=2487322 RepID=A0A3N9TXJ4_9VIBR|nr:hypothetical protein [Vibrio viridaestus]RQW61652.1 hypothetical protein EES38_18805 [Vibrio viridaestus]